MKSGIHTINTEAQILLTSRELQLLHHLCSYDNAKWAKQCETTYYHGGVSVDEATKFLDMLRAVTGQQMELIRRHGELLFKSDQVEP